MKISFELVPRDLDTINTQISFIKNELDFVQIVNVPDIIRLDIRSFNLSKELKDFCYIPHLRAIDFKPHSNALNEILQNVKNVLVIGGDKHEGRKSYDTSSLDLISHIANNYPHITIYAGFDPYRSSPKQELDYMREKINAGASYLMSQPIFDTCLASFYLNAFEPQKLFLGLSPVLNEKSMNYWTNINNVVFERTFSLDLSANIQRAIDTIDLCYKNDTNLYFMPIKTDLHAYFSPISKHLKELLC